MRLLLITLLCFSSLAADELSLCGVLTTAGYGKLNFIVPGNPDSHKVERYEVVNFDSSVPPLESMANWWICVSEGEIITSHLNRMEK